MPSRFPLALLLFAISFLCAPPLECQTMTLPFRPVTAEYSSGLDRIIMISANPNQVHIFNPLTNSDTTVNLAKPPLSLSVSLDGLHAAVGHDSLISYVNLSTAVVEKTLTAATTVTNLVLGNDWVYVLSYSAGIKAIQISTAVALPGYGVYTGSQGRLHPSGNAIYTTQDSLSPEHLQTIDVSTGPPTRDSQGPYHGDYPVCGGVWFSPDGHRAYTSCAAVYQANPQNPSEYGARSVTADGMYWSTLAGIAPIRSLTESASRKLVAAIPGSYPSNSQPTKDNQIFLYDSDYLEPAGTFQLPDFLVNSTAYQAHAQQVFFSSASSSLYVVMQADGAAGLLQDFAVHLIPLGNPPACTPSFTTSLTTLAAAGTVASTGISALPTCIYRATSNADWIQIVSGAYGSGSGTLTYIARRNTGNARIGTISLGSQTFTVTQLAAGAAGSVIPLGYSVVGAEYSKALDKVIMIVTNPNELHIYDPVSGLDQIVALPKAPSFVSVGPDGLSAAVGMDGWVAVVNLSTASITTTLKAYTDAHTVLMAGHGYVYAYPKSTWGDLFAIQLSTGAIATQSSIYDGRYPRLYADGNVFYTEGSKWDISAGIPQYVYRTTSAVCSPFWLTEDGARMITSCGRAYTTSPVTSQDLNYNGSFANAAAIQWAAESALLQSTAVIPGNVYPSTSGDTFLQIYGDASLSYLGSLALPAFPAGSSSYTPHGRYVFWNSTADKLIVLEQADPLAQIAADYGVVVFPLSIPTQGCTFTLGGTAISVDSSGGANTLTVTTGAGCIWEAKSNAPWLTVTAGAVAFGGSTLNYNVAANSTANSRTGTLTVAGQTYTVTQNGTNTFLLSRIASPSTGGTLTATPPSADGFYVTGTSVQLTASANPGCTFTSFSGDLTGASPQSISMTTNRIVTANFSCLVPPTTALQFTPVTPCRIMDTRTGQGYSGPFGPPSLTGGSARDIPITSSACNIPSTAQAYSLNITILPKAGTVQFLTVWPSGQPRPLVSTLNSWDGSTIANAAIVRAGVAGAVSVYSTDNADLVIDVNGYFIPPSAGSLVFYPLTPCRLMDTRNPTGTLGGPALTGGVSRDLPVTASPCGVSSAARAYSLNVTVVPKGGLYYVTTWPAGQPQPNVSTLNSFDGSVLANAAIVPAGANGAVSFYASQNTDLVVDINGYFAPPGTGGLNFYAVTPCRVVDTRNAPGTLGGPILQTGEGRSFPIAQSPCGLPPTAGAYSTNMTVVPSGAMYYLTVWPTGFLQPFVSTLNDYKGLAVANAALLPAGTSGAISAYVSNTSNLVIDVNGYFGQ